MASTATAQRLCGEEMADQVDLTVVDIRSDSAALADERIAVAPSLDQRHPPPPRQIVGNLAIRDRLLASLDVAP